jgi:hypothetical protein
LRERIQYDKGEEKKEENVKEYGEKIKDEGEIVVIQ